MIKKKKLNSYFKVIFTMAIGGAIGAALSMTISGSEAGLKEFLDCISLWISGHIVLLMCILAVISVLTCLICHIKGKHLVRRFSDCCDDDQLEAIEKSYDFWAALGSTVSNVSIYLTLGILAFGLSMSGREDAVKVLIATALTIFTSAICEIYQVALVKQMKAKAPLKKGDASDFKFTKEWLNSCDEAEKRLIFEASYKTLHILRIVLLVTLVIAMMAELYFSTGLTAVVLLTICNIAAAIVYAYYSVRLEKCGLNVL